MGVAVVHGDAKREAVLGLLAQGLTGRDAAIVVGVGHVTVSNWAKDAGVVLQRGAPSTDRWDEPDADSDWVDSNGRLTLTARVLIQIRHRSGLGNAAIAREIGVHRSTIGRELGRLNESGLGYRAARAHAMALVARKRPKPMKLAAAGTLRAEVVRLLDDKFSPEQVSAELRQLYPGREDMRVSHEAIYQALYVQAKGCLRDELKAEKALRSGRTTRRSASRLGPRSNRGWIGDAHISARPAEAEDRAVPGHWEGDLVIGTDGSSALITLAERTTRFVLIYRLGGRHDTNTVTTALTKMMQRFPDSLRRSLTWDQGSEMAQHASFTVATGCPVYFCDPHSPWQRGTNENTNGLVRDFFPKGTDFTTVTDEAVADAERLLNIRPRKTLGWAKPGIMMNELLNVAPTT